MNSYKFYKNENGWFVDLPDWTGEVWELQMVMGADKFLDIISEGKNETYLILSKHPFDGSDTLHYECQGLLEGPELGEGSWYFLNEYNGTPYNLRMWLCDVTKFVFNEFPMKIYFSKQS